jgi:hypothetical protein
MYYYPVTPVKTGVQSFCNCMKYLDTGFRRYDEFEAFANFYEGVNSAD